MITSMAPLTIAVLTVMLWLIWGDTVRPRKSSRLTYSVRTLLFLATTGLMIYRAITLRSVMSTTETVLLLATAAVGVGGTVYFGRKLSKRS